MNSCNAFRKLIYCLTALITTSGCIERDTQLSSNAQYAGASGTSQGFVIVSGNNVVSNSNGSISKIDPATDAVMNQMSFSDAAAMATDSKRGMIYLARTTPMISVVEPNTFEKVDISLAQLGKIPIGASLTPDGRTLLVTTRGADGISNADDRLEIISLNPDVWPPSIQAVNSVVTGSQPINVVVDHNGRYAVVTVRNQPAILVIDLQTRQIVSQASGLPSNAEPEGIDIHPTENIVYAVLHGSNKIVILDMNQSPPRFTGSVSISSRMGSPQPSGGKFTPNGMRFFVSGQVTSEVLLFNTTNPQNPVQDTSVSLRVGAQPHEIVFLPCNRAYVANTNNGGAHGSISVVENYGGLPTVVGEILTNLVGPKSFASFVVDPVSCN